MKAIAGPRGAWVLAALGYLCLAVVLSWPLVLHLGSAVPGIPNVDLWDSAWLRLAVSRGLLEPTLWPHSAEIHAPVGYPVGALVPNYVDHLSGAPFALGLPWPLGDGLWWLLVLAANGLSGHILGRQLGGSHRHGALVGIAFACAEPILREANLGHGPTAIWCWAPLFLAATLEALAPEGRRNHAILAGAFLALSALTYWYQGLFLAVLVAPLAARAVGRDRRALTQLAWIAGVAALLCSAPLAMPLVTWGALPMAATRSMPELLLAPEATVVPVEHQWTFAHGSDLLWPLRRAPLDRANRLSLVLVVAAAWGVRREGRRSWPWLVAAAIGGVLLMGPFLKWGEQPVLVAGRLVPLPGVGLAELHPLLARLTWPQRWGIVVVLALLPLATRVPRPGWWAAALLVECLAVSGNAPLHLTPVESHAGWRQLDRADGAILLLPLDRGGPHAPTVGFVYRACRRPLSAPVAVPPGAHPPRDWERWREASPFAEWLAHPGSSLPPAALDQLRTEGFAAIALDATPGGLLDASGVDRHRRRLELALGPAEDYGSALVWWLEPPEEVPAPWTDGDEWRARQRDALAHQPAPPHTVFRPHTWNVGDR